ncbi:uncharacterized protein LOC128801686 [Vidua chalybeata]|uniref:uncharacterized protein LOC128801686 n=1 Tax=Vidua chalybeata TaxID=81927 RepID=UPI0023A8657A|nr:uncharacterized protein LOC128801686 [Vidua chalybeata]
MLRICQLIQILSIPGFQDRKRGRSGCQGVSLRWAVAAPGAELRDWEHGLGACGELRGQAGAVGQLGLSAGRCLTPPAPGRAGTGPRPPGGCGTPRPLPGPGELPALPAGGAAFGHCEASGDVNFPARSRRRGSHLCPSHSKRDEAALLRQRLLPRQRREGERGQPLPQRPRPRATTGRTRHKQAAAAPCRPLRPQRAPSPRRTQRGSHLRRGRLPAPPMPPPRPPAAAAAPGPAQTLRQWRRCPARAALRPPAGPCFAPLSPISAPQPRLTAQPANRSEGRALHTAPPRPALSGPPGLGEGKAAAEEQPWNGPGPGPASSANTNKLLRTSRHGFPGPAPSLPPPLRQAHEPRFSCP